MAHVRSASLCRWRMRRRREGPRHVAPGCREVAEQHRCLYQQDQSQKSDAYHQQGVSQVPAKSPRRAISATATRAMITMRIFCAKIVKTQTLTNAQYRRAANDAAASTRTPPRPARRQWETRSDSRSHPLPTMLGPTGVRHQTAPTAPTALPGQRRRRPFYMLEKKLSGHLIGDRSSQPQADGRYDNQDQLHIAAC